MRQSPKPYIRRDKVRKNPTLCPGRFSMYPDVRVVYHRRLAPTAN